MIKLECQLSPKRRLDAHVRLVAGSSGVSGGQMQQKTVTPALTAQVVTPDSGYAGMSRVNVEAVALEAKAVIPGTSAQIVKADSALGLSRVTVNAAPLQEKTIVPSTEQQTVKPDAGFYGLGAVLVAAFGYTDIADIEASRDGNEVTITTTLADGETVTSVLTLDDSGLPYTITHEGETFAAGWQGVTA